ncbi:hypothetical protein PMIN04_002654 [Paraphaeosphaeria minitans]
MEFTTDVAIAVLAFTNMAVADALLREWTGSLSARADTLGRRQIEIGGLKLGTGGNATTGAAGGQTQGGSGGGLAIGGLTLGGSNGGISGNDLSLPGGQNNNQSQRGQPGKAPAAEPAAPAAEPKVEPQSGAGSGTEKQPGRNEGEAAAAAEAKGEAAATKGETAAEAGKSNGVKATEESERLSKEAVITLNKNGSAANLGGNLGITQGSDGSKSIRGENGINIAANGQATDAGTERE